ncbi:MAG: hypothetical protein LUP94_00995 [Candidatus Methanomethylicus sp.]|nr:hypothetical protein [Candidatus Methanomethylicus sp.]
MFGGGIPMVSDFSGRVIAHATKQNFEKIASRSLKDIFGEPCASSIIYHLGGSEVLQEPRAFETKIESIFGVGADLILDHILNEVENPKKTRRRRV